MNYLYVSYILNSLLKSDKLPFMPKFAFTFACRGRSNEFAINFKSYVYYKLLSAPWTCWRWWSRSASCCWRSRSRGRDSHWQAGSTRVKCELFLSKFFSYLIFVIFLHRQNFWRIKSTPKKRVNYDKIHSKLTFFCVITPKYTVNCQFFALNL